MSDNIHVLFAAIRKKNETQDESIDMYSVSVFLDSCIAKYQEFDRSHPVFASANLVIRVDKFTVSEKGVK